MNIEIPDIFHTFEDGQPFKSCIICGRDLLKGDTKYIIEKAIKRYPDFDTTDVVFEYAMCIPCTEQMRDSMSSESRQKIDAYFLDRVLPESRVYYLDESNQVDMDECISKCLVNGKTIDELSEYQILAHCSGKEINFPYLPFMLCGDVIEEVQELISEETRDEMDDFIDEHFGLPPEYKDLIKPKDLILI